MNKTEDPIETLARLGRIIHAGSGSLDIIADTSPEYVRGARFVYEAVAKVIQKEIDYLKGNRLPQRARCAQRDQGK